MKVLVILNDAPYGSERTYNGRLVRRISLEFARLGASAPAPRSRKWTWGLEKKARRVHRCLFVWTQRQTRRAPGRCAEISPEARGEMGIAANARSSGRTRGACGEGTRTRT